MFVFSRYGSTGAATKEVGKPILVRLILRILVNTCRYNPHALQLGWRAKNQNIRPQFKIIANPCEQQRRQTKELQSSQ